MSAHTHAHHDSHGASRAADSLNRTALVATLHCLTGCAVGEVLGVVIGTSLGWSNAATIALAVTLAFAFGYTFTTVPLLRSGLALGVALPLAFAADSLSIAVMEVADNGVMLAVPGAMGAGVSEPLFWGALGFALAVAFVVALPLNRALIARGRGHAVVHGHHAGSGSRGEGAADAPRRFVLIGLAAVATTLVVTVGAALLLEEGAEHEPAPPAHAEMR